MKLTEVIAIWDILHIKQVGELGYCDLEAAIEEVTGPIENDVPGCHTTSPCGHFLREEKNPP